MVCGLCHCLEFPCRGKALEHTVRRIIIIQHTREFYFCLSGGQLPRIRWCVSVAIMGIDNGNSRPYGYRWRSCRNFVVFVAVFSLFTGKKNHPHQSIFGYRLLGTPLADFCFAHSRETPLWIPCPDLEGHARVPPRTFTILHPNGNNSHAHNPRLMLLVLCASDRASRG